MEGRYCFSRAWEYWMYWTSGGRAGSGMAVGGLEVDIVVVGEVRVKMKLFGGLDERRVFSHAIF